MKILICGYPRAGTSLFYNMLYTTVQGYHFEAVEKSGQHNDWKENEVRKFPLDILHYDKIKQQFPDIKFLVCIRDPRDLLCSKHWHFPDKFKISWNEAIHSKQKDGSMKMMNIGLYDVYKAIDNARNDKMFLIRFEDLINIPDLLQIQFNHIFNYAGDFKDFHQKQLPVGMIQQLNGVRPLDKSRIGTWKQYPERIKQQFTECPALFDILMDYGYETDREWFEGLS